MPENNIVEQFLSNWTDLSKVRKNKHNRDLAEKLERMKPGSQPKELLK